MMKEMAKRKERPIVKPTQPWQMPGVETAVVYEDELPWNKEKGVCFEIVEARKNTFDIDLMEIEWRVTFSGDRKVAYTRRVSRESSEWYVDQLRREARLDILYRAHKEGII